MSERGRDGYVRPPLVAREPRPHWHSVWRFRIGVLVIILLLAWVVLLVARHFVDTEQNPGFGTSPAPVVGAALLR